MFLQLQPQRPLHALQSLTDIDLNRCASRFEFGTAFELRLCFVRPTKPGVSETEEIVTTRILASLLNRFGKQLVSLLVFAGEVGMYPLPVHLL